MKSLKIFSGIGRAVFKPVNNPIIDVAAFLAALVFVISGSLVSLNRFWQYEIFYYNFGVFDMAIWNVSRLRPPVIEHMLVSGRILLADHFDLSILLLAPLYWITDRSEILLIVQALFAGCAGFVIYLIGREVLKNKLAALSISLCYLFFTGIQNAVITDFHELTVMTLPLSLTFLFIVRKQLKLFWLFFLLTLGFKEVTFLLGIGIGIFIYFYPPSRKISRVLRHAQDSERSRTISSRMSAKRISASEGFHSLLSAVHEALSVISREFHNRKWSRHALAAIIVSGLWGFVTIKLLIPYFSGGIYLHMPDLAEGVAGKILALADTSSKRDTLFYSFWQFGFLPIFSPSLWFAIFQDYAMRFMPKYTVTYWTLGLHYNAVVSVLLATASVFGFKFLLRIKQFDKFQNVAALILIMNAFFLFRFVHHGAFLMSINPVLYSHTANFKYLDEMIAKIPKNASVMTQNNLGVRFTHQKFIYLRETYDAYAPDYIVIDNRAGQNPNNFLFGPGNIDEFLEKLKSDKKYKAVYQKNQQYIYKRL